MSGASQPWRARRHSLVKGWQTVLQLGHSRKLPAKEVEGWKSLKGFHQETDSEPCSRKTALEAVWMTKREVILWTRWSGQTGFSRCGV